MRAPLVLDAAKRGQVAVARANLFTSSWSNAERAANVNNAVDI